MQCKVRIELKGKLEKELQELKGKGMITRVKLDEFHCGESEANRQLSIFLDSKDQASKRNHYLILPLKEIKAAQAAKPFGKISARNGY
ncbi:hypothetical protein scyTo_0003686 [Scyliorhinus torazame]|uniref:Uncharacterized protein n=1 Tax=Scyliorhinus torazame TaxID=75743 RepID=A0A401PNB2_SCYTO|nr:hypothetical protein [Scyliorhinus torazame]